MKYNPHEYQRYAVRFIVEHPEAALLLDMGMGKTSIVLTALNELIYGRFEVGKVLVIAPLRVARNTWPAEIEKWDHLKGMTYAVILGTEAERLAALTVDADIYIINRENLFWLVEKSGVPFDFDMIVIDELSSFKSWQSKRFRALMKVRPRVRRAVGLTGTPSGNGLMDLFAEFRCLDMGKRLGRFISQYRLEYFQPDKRNGQMVYSYAPLPGAEERIYEKIADITVSMRASDFLQMPELVTSEYRVYLSGAERDCYEQMKKEFVLSLPEKEVTAANVAALTGKLAQLANGAVYGDDGKTVVVHSRKLDALEDILEAAGGKPVLIAYWYKHDLERISQRLEKLRLVWRILDSDESIREWNSGVLTAGLIHPASAGHGLNLQSGGDTMIWYGLTWSLELYQQTVARLWRQGQVSGTVKVLHIVTEGTVDERILQALEKKEISQAELIDAVKAEVWNGEN